MIIVFFMLKFGYIMTLIIYHSKILVIKDPEKEIKNLLKQFIPFIGKHLRVLAILKQNEKVGISKREVTKLAEVDPNSVRNWKNLYLNDRIRVC